MRLPWRRQKRAEGRSAPTGAPWWNTPAQGPVLGTGGALTLAAHQRISLPLLARSALTLAHSVAVLPRRAFGPDGATATCPLLDLWEAPNAYWADGYELTRAFVLAAILDPSAALKVERDGAGEPLAIRPVTLTLRSTEGGPVYRETRSGEPIARSDLVMLRQAARLFGDASTLAQDALGIAADEVHGAMRSMSRANAGGLSAWRYSPYVGSVADATAGTEAAAIETDLFRDRLGQVLQGGPAWGGPAIAVIDPEDRFESLTSDSQTAIAATNARTAVGEDAASALGVPREVCGLGDQADADTAWRSFARGTLASWSANLESALAPAAAPCQVRLDLRHAARFDPEAIVMLRQASIINANEARDMIGLPPSPAPAADDVFAPANAYQPRRGEDTPTA